MPIAARAKLATRLIVLAAAGLAIAGLSGCDATSTSGPSIIPTADPDTRQVTVVGSGEVQGTPDTLTANVVDQVQRARRHRRHEPDQRPSAGRDQRAGELRHRPQATSARPT